MYVTVDCGKIARMKQRSAKEGNEREVTLGFLPRKFLSVLVNGSNIVKGDFWIRC